MAEPKTIETICSWAISSEIDDRIWESMTRGQQLAALQELANHPNSTTVTPRAVAEIVARARKSKTAE
jgi:hypothetical protein